MRPIRLRGARVHNLKGIDLDFSAGQLVAITGPSGAGKSSLAFSTLYAEGQRRYVESFSAYARQFLERLARPEVDSLESVPAAIAVDRQAPVKTSRSTVGTMTELADYAKELWATSASLVCPTCSVEVTTLSAGDCADQVLHELSGQRIVITYDCEVRDREHFVGVRDALVSAGYRRLWHDGATLDLDDTPPSRVIAEGEATLLSVVVDRARAQPRDRSRLVEAFEVALARGRGDARVFGEEGASRSFSNRLRCSTCATEYKRPSAALFSYNSAVGACETCRGFGRTIGIDWAKVIPDEGKSLAGGAIRPWRSGDSTVWERKLLTKRARAEGIPLDVPFRELTKAQRAFILDGDGGDWHQGWFGVRGWFQWLETRAYKMHVRVLLSRYRSYDPCTTCNGARLKKEAWAWKVGGISLPDLYALPVTHALELLTTVTLPNADERLRRACCDRLTMLCDVGLGYLTLDRASRSLSGGELQRVALTGALSASLTGALFVLDEPTVGLHPTDVARLAGVVRKLTDGGNIALVVEHDTAMIELADRVVELGEGGGDAGGTVVFDGTPTALRKAHTKTAHALRDSAVTQRTRRVPTGWVTLTGASGNNLRDTTLSIPVGVLTCVTGVSGSGKSSLVIDTFYAAVANHLGTGDSQPLSLPLPFKKLTGHTGFVRAVLVDQAPMGRTSRGNPATFLGTWDHVRALFASQPLSKQRGYTTGTFSFNVAGGRCETCRGEGAETVEMQFLADVTFSCPDCGGRRFAGPVLDVHVRGKSIADVLTLSAEDAVSFFDELTKPERGIRQSLAPLIDVGAGYLRLGQPLSTVSGGEAQRLKLAAELSGGQAALIVLDEPTAGLHPSDVEPLLSCLERLVSPTTAIVVVEHDMRVAAFCDHVIDVGPGAGAEGGTVVASTTPEQLADNPASATAPFLARALGRKVKAPAKEKRKTVPAASVDGIRLRGAREHNLKNVDLLIPHEQLVVITGPSGSGKSTIAFDIVFAEGQRRYLETLSPFARQYLPQLPRPDVDEVTGVPPAVSLEQRTTSGGVNSTVATITEIAHYVRLLFARVGVLSCPDCALPIEPRSATKLALDIQQRYGAQKVSVLAPIVRGRKGEHNEVIRKAIARGCSEARIDGVIQPIEERMKLVRAKEHDVEALVGKFAANAPQLLPALQTALDLGEGAALILRGDEELWVSSSQSCSRCGRGFPVLDPRHFSFNTRQGACEVCEGRGVVERTRGRGKKAVVEEVRCDDCNGTRLAGLSRHVSVAGHTIDAWLSVDVDEAVARLSVVELVGREREVGKRLVDEAVLRLRFLQRVGLGYLELDRGAATLSGGEMQRVRLAAQLGSGLTGVLYVLDEPTIGLHPRDTGRLLQALRDLVNAGCSVLVVEHDADTIRSADHLIDVGPGGGHLGGTVLGQGKPAELLAQSHSVTGEALSRPMPDASARRSTRGVEWLELRGASEHNLKNVSVRLPVGRLSAVTGVSGSGKSTLVRDVLLRAVREQLGLATDASGKHQKLTGADAFKRAVEIDQSPIGRTPRSVPATYIGVWDELRKLYAMTPLARSRGYTASRFSFNSNAGRCPVCEGQGQTSVEMSFLPQVSMVCDACDGLRFNNETLDVRLHGVSAGELLSLHIDQVIPIVAAFPKVQRPLSLLSQLGLGYLKLGQASNTLSGGEAQRLKLVSELSTASVAGTLYVMDEPTTGLHRNDVHRLLSVLHALVDQGSTVVVIEHQPDVILASDWVVDLGPEGGRGGGSLVVAGSPEAVMQCADSHTGRALIEEIARVDDTRQRR